MLWVDQHRPKALYQLEQQAPLTQRLLHMAQHSDSLPHLLFHGPSGAGKRTHIMALLEEIYGSSVHRLKLDNKVWKHNSKVVEIPIVSSNWHLELTPADAGSNSDTLVIQDVIKEIAQTHTLGMSRKSYKIVVLNEADRLSRLAQQALRRTMENCRIILCCQNLSKIIDPLRSRCLSIRVQAPSKDKIVHILQEVASKENFAQRIAEASNGNLRRAILSLEAARVQQYPFSDHQEIVSPDWERVVSNIAHLLKREQSPQCLMQVRGLFYQLLGNCIPAQVILKTLLDMLLTSVPDSVKFQVVQIAAEFDHRLMIGDKPIFHLEAFCARFMVTFKRSTIGGC